MSARTVDVDIMIMISQHEARTATSIDITHILNYVLVSSCIFSRFERWVAR